MTDHYDTTHAPSKDPSPTTDLCSDHNQETAAGCLLFPFAREIHSDVLRATSLVHQACPGPGRFPCRINLHWEQKPNHKYCAILRRKETRRHGALHDHWGGKCFLH